MNEILELFRLLVNALDRGAAALERQAAATEATSKIATETAALTNRLLTLQLAEVEPTIPTATEAASGGPIFQFRN